MSLARSRRLRNRNLVLSAMALVLGIGLLVFGLRTPWDMLWVFPLFMLCLMVWLDVQAAHPRRSYLIAKTTPDNFGVTYEDVHFPSRDGLKLSGYLLRGSRPEAVILVHGSGGGGVTLTSHGRGLQAAGYNVLMIDLRAHGRSEGWMIDGVQEANDVLGAVDFLATQTGIAADRLGALGVSLGGHTVLHAARQTENLRAVILEGIGPNCLEDHGGRPTSLRRWINYPINWATYKLADFISGTKVESMTSTLGRLNRPLLLISCGRGKEQYFTRLLFKAASEPKELWEIPRARHAGGFFQDSTAYTKMMVGFFDRYLA
jgi:pimeloyl-ACP methyl ester carboxylesterase